MKHFLIKDAMLKLVIDTASTTASGTSTVSDRAGTSSDPYLSVAGYLSVQVLSQAATASGAPTVTTKLMGVDQSTTSGASSTTIASTSDTAVAAGDITSLVADAQNLSSYPYVYLKRVVKSGKGTLLGLYVLEAMSKPVTQTDIDASTTVAG